MAKLANIIIVEILKFIYQEGGNPKIWCVGVTSDPRRQLFDEHRVHYQNDAWIYRLAASESEALQIQLYFLEFGLVEEEEGWQPGARTVYAYRKHNKKTSPKRHLQGARGRCSSDYTSKGKNRNGIPTLDWLQRNTVS